MRVFVTGGTGLIGTRLVRRLRERGDEVLVLTRRPPAARDRFGEDVEVVEGDPMQEGAWMDAVDRCDSVINLAGENVFARRWSTRFKALLRDSRLRGTENVVRALAKNPRRADGKAKVLVNASAIGYYGPHADEELTEDSDPGSDFLAVLCVDWEKAALEARKDGLRVALVRVGVVLDREGGALAKMLTPFKLFVGGKVGSGRQWMSWIHHDDMVGLFLLALDDERASGPLNGTAPNPVTNKEFSKALGRALHRPALLPAPRLALRVVLGKVADVIATGQRVLPRRPLALGYQFKFPTIDTALTAIVAK
jgi:uncharacterized protein (TIGR01777 family)